MSTRHDVTRHSRAFVRSFAHFLVAFVDVFRARSRRRLRCRPTVAARVRTSRLRPLPVAADARQRARDSLSAAEQLFSRRSGRRVASPPEVSPVVQFVVCRDVTALSLSRRGHAFRPSDHLLDGESAPENRSDEPSSRARPPMAVTNTHRYRERGMRRRQRLQTTSTTTTTTTAAPAQDYYGMQSVIASTERVMT